MFHVTWTTFKFNRNQLGTVLAYVMWLRLIALLMCTLKWLSSIEIQYHKRFHLKPKAAINYTEISSLICKTILIFNEHNFQYNGGNMTEDLAAVSDAILLMVRSEILCRVIFRLWLNEHIDYSRAQRSWHTLKPFPVGSYWIYKWPKLREISIILFYHWVGLSK